MGLLKELTSPLGAVWCDYYYYIMVFTLIMFLLQFVSSGYGVILKILGQGKGVMVAKDMMLLINSFLMYFSARLLYSICTGSLKT